MSDLAAVVTVTLNPAIDQTLHIPGFHAGQVNRVESSRVDAGGKGINVASVLADLGVPVTATGFLGDANLALFESYFQQKKISDRLVRIPGATRTGIKIVDAEAGETTDINFPGLTPGADDVERLMGALRLCAAPGRWFVLSGSLPPGLSLDLYSRLMAEIRSQGGRIVLDTSGEPLRQALPHAPEIVKPNLSELEELAGHALQTPQAVVAAAASLVRNGVALAVVSMGAQGAIFASREAAVLARPPKVQVKSTVGAGDAMVAGLVYAQLKGLGLEATARLATALGAYSVTRFGAGVDLEQLHGLEQQVQVENAGADTMPAAARNGD